MKLHLLFLSLFLTLFSRCCLQLIRPLVSLLSRIGCKVTRKEISEARRSMIYVCFPSITEREREKLYSYKHSSLFPTIHSSLLPPLLLFPPSLPPSCFSPLSHTLSWLKHLRSVQTKFQTSNLQR